MDTLSHLLTGAAIGQITAGRKTGRKALFWGAAAANMPDADVFFQNLFSPLNSLFFHRGISHSLLFWLILSPCFAFMSTKIHKGTRTDFATQLKISSAAWFSHIFVDAFNTYGTGIFLPFSRTRIAFDCINVVDLFFTLPLLIAFVFYMIFKNADVKKIAAISGLAISMTYFGFTVVNKVHVNNTARHQIAMQNIDAERILTAPLPLSNLAWLVVVEEAGGFRSGIYYRPRKNEIRFEFIPGNESVIESYRNISDFVKIERFTKNWFVADSTGPDNLTIYDLRFGSLSDEETDRYVIKFEVERYGDAIKVKRTRPKRYITLKNAKDYYKQIFSKQT